VIVATTAGKVQGREKRGVLQYRGIPYATAERFQAATPIEGWDGVRDATRFGPMAPQNKAPLESMVGGQNEPGREDCLVLNVFTPATPPSDGTARPVMVWVHGGGFVSGSGHVPWYDGSHLARSGDVVVVTINYRLGALGFLHLGHLDGELSGSGSNGLRDQVTALRWVRDNIAAFGGDPGNVTLFGESAGAMSVGALLGIPEAAGLFQRAILQSGAASNVQVPEMAEWVTERFLTHAGLSAAGADGLVDLPVDEVLRIQSVIETEVFRGDGPGVHAAAGVLAFQPTVDGTLMERPPLDTVAAGNAAGVRVVVGTTHDEWDLFHLSVRQQGPLDEVKTRRRLGRVVGEDRANDILEAYREAMPEASFDDLVCAAMTDRVFRIPAIRLAEAQAAHAPVWMYRFDLASRSMAGLLRACHAIEIPFVFGNLDRGGVDVLIGGIDDGAQRLSDRCVRSWTTMARAGDPEHDDLAWPAYDTGRRATAVLDRSPAVLDDPDAEFRELWAGVGGIEPQP
jgi:para-nitrobenzyl esterase